MTKTVKLIDLDPPKNDFLNDVICGLSTKPKYLLPIYFYDETGSKLFDQICELKEYYPTRTELGILEKKNEAIEAFLDKNTRLVEFGSGSSTKIRLLLDESEKIQSYMPIDISKEHLTNAAQSIADAYPDLSVTAVCADYTRLNKLPTTPANETQSQAIFFPGSTLGNLTETSARDLLKNAHQMLDKNGKLIIGIDLIKDMQTLVNAYNDSKGITAKFNKNILIRANRELNANFDLDKFSHKAIFNETYRRIEMHLFSLEAQTVTIADHQFHFEKGESIHTESSHKYDLNEFKAFCKTCGFELSDAFTDENEYFAVCALTAI
jgi:dimethylhistidine N-methyltransferase